MRFDFSMRLAASTAQSHFFRWGTAGGTAAAAAAVASSHFFATLRNTVGASSGPRPRTQYLQ